jgi:hypothetical protein
MANQDAAFGLRAIGKVGQNKDNQGLSEYNIAASSAAIYQNDAVQFQTTGYIRVGVANVPLLGTLNGIFYTDASTSKPTWANSTLAIANIGTNADISFKAGVTPNYVSKSEVLTSATTASTAQFRILGVAKDIENSEKLNATTYAANVNVVGIINEHFLKQTAGI